MSNKLITLIFLRNDLKNMIFYTLKNIKNIEKVEYLNRDFGNWSGSYNVLFFEIGLRAGRLFFF